MPLKRRTAGALGINFKKKLESRCRSCELSVPLRGGAAALGVICALKRRAAMGVICAFKRKRSSSPGKKFYKKKLESRCRSCELSVPVRRGAAAGVLIFPQGWELAGGAGWDLGRLIFPQEWELAGGWLAGGRLKKIWQAAAHMVIFIRTAKKGRRGAAE